MSHPNWISVELTSRCQKSCSFCGRAKARAEGMVTGDMPMEIFDNIIHQFTGDIIQFHRDGEPLLYHSLREVGEKCRRFTANIVTNGILLWDKRDDLKDNFTSVTVSVFEEDAEQFETVKKFKEYIGNSNPMIYVKFLGDYYNYEYAKLGLKTLTRSIHNPEQDTDYLQSIPPIPEIGVCLDLLYKPSIDWQGNMYICNRIDPEGSGKLGNLNESTLNDLWFGQKRRDWLNSHLIGRREDVPLCSKCSYWGIPAV